TLSYKKVGNVDGYLIYGGKCGEEMKLLAEVSDDTTSYNVKGLKQGTNYKYMLI
ncbi:MAG: fibronectin type III domain-containing protein, partial [Clostridiales bacterium]|nr:fibronectin type III domain-containing protein [Clostridiales bacterium]